jgi:hypothetical protein
MKPGYSMTDVEQLLDMDRREIYKASLDIPRRSVGGNYLYNPDTILWLSQVLDDRRAEVRAGTLAPNSSIVKYLEDQGYDSVKASALEDGFND